MLYLRPLAMPVRYSFTFLLGISLLSVSAAESPHSWYLVDADRDGLPVEIRSPTNRPILSGQPFIVVTHGMFGTEPDDRFHQLAEAISSVAPNANVLLVNWSEPACPKTTLFGLPNAIEVANRINPVGDKVADMLCHIGFCPAQSILIGESFGNWINARITQQLGEVDRILAMNPASELGGYAPTDLRLSARTSWAFHSDSLFDTRRCISHRSIILIADRNCDMLEMHKCGILRLTKKLNDGDDSWLRDECHLIRKSSDHFDAAATPDGKLIPTELLRELPMENPETHQQRIASEKTKPPGIEAIAAN